MMAASGSLKVWASMFAALLVAGVLAAGTFVSGAEAQEIGCTGDVVLDAGHGGSDPGAVNSRYGLKEKVQTLDVARRLEVLLEADGYKVCMTRTSNSETLSDSDRYTYANATGAKILVSIHMNGSSNTATDYTTTLYGKWRKDKDLAQTVFGSLSTLPAAGGTGTIATRAPYSFASGVLLKSNMPAIIAETVFITSDKEGQLLSNGTGSRQQQIAEKLEAGIETYLSTH
ncbi:MAG: N-acetylmuramoyl-L-alanine amidase family protein [Rubrobacteraceae bacterium]